MEAIAFGLEAIAFGLEAIALRLEAIAIRMEAIAISVQLELIRHLFQCSSPWVVHFSLDLLKEELRHSEIL